VDLPYQLLNPIPMQYSLRWQVLGAVDGKPASGVDVVARPATAGSAAIQAMTAGDGRSPRQLDDKMPVNYQAIVGSGDWVIEIDDGFAPQALENNDWHDDEATGNSEEVELDA
jgi:hypothetical protein